jgi:hypothetical protein
VSAPGLTERCREAARESKKDAHDALEHAKETNSDSAALSNIPLHDGLEGGRCGGGSIREPCLTGALVLAHKIGEKGQRCGEGVV